MSKSGHFRFKNKNISNQIMGLLDFGNGRISTPTASQKLSIAENETSRQHLTFPLGPEPWEGPRTPKIEVSDPKNKNISNHMLGLFEEPGCVSPDASINLK